MSLYSQTYETPWSYGEEENQAIPPLVSRAARVTPLEWPITIPIHVFDNVKLKAEWWEIWKSKSESINIDTNLLLGGKLDYTIKYTQGTPIAEIANISFDGKKIVSERLLKGETKSGTIDLTGLIGKTATTTISFDSFLGIWSEVLFDIWITLGYSETPTPPPDKWPYIAPPISFSGKLAPGWTQEAKDTMPIRNVDLTKLLGGRVDYALKYESGKLQGITLYIYWNDELMATEPFLIGQVGKIISGTFDLGAARIRATNVLTVKMSQAPLGYNICSFDCPTILGFSEKPKQPPSGEEWWDTLFEWLDKNKYWIALGVAGVGVILLYRPSPPVIIYQTPKQREG